MPSEQDLLNMVTGSNASLGAALAGSNVYDTSPTAFPSLDITTYGTDANGVPQSAASSSGFWSSLGNFKGLTGNGASINDLLGGIGSAATSVSNAASAGSAAIAFITDIPRVATTVLGLILIIAGIFALSKGPAVNIVTTAVRDTVTS